MVQLKDPTHLKTLGEKSISIPNGSIKRLSAQSTFTLNELISIPNGSIKSHT